MSRPDIDTKATVEAGVEDMNQATSLGLSSASETPSLLPTIVPTRVLVRVVIASALCRDGTYSYSRSRRGTCSWHGGVSVWNPTIEVTATPAPSIAPTHTPTITPTPSLQRPGTGQVQYEQEVVSLIAQEAIVYQEYLDLGVPAPEQMHQWVGAVRELEQRTIRLIHRWSDIAPPEGHSTFHELYQRYPQKVCK